MAVIFSWVSASRSTTTSWGPNRVDPGAGDGSQPLDDLPSVSGVGVDQYQCIAAMAWPPILWRIF
ncbi:MAG: hypothetical protein VX581_00755, partial [Chloroflexota bacterium]|nr:hypothetical protein [Chloroflexota bacterium]